MAIKPINIPSAAGLNFGEGDVRHLSEGDAMDVPGITNPTRQLAYRDSELASKLNETIEVVNNKEQFVPLPILRTTVSPNEEITVTNYRIPTGFEARILNASVAATPVSPDIELNIYYATGFGNTTGTVMVTTSDESASGTSFKSAGEFIISIKNKGGTTLDIVASVLLTMRPIGAEGTLLVGSVLQGAKGDPGQTGPRGLQGIPGTGGAGSPGMVWDGEWISAKSYQPKTVVSFPLYGTVISSYFCTVAHTSDLTNQPPNVNFWDTVALGSAGSVVGAVGPTGPAGGVPTYGAASVTGTIVPDGDYVGGTGEQGYTGGGSAFGTTTVQWNQYFIDSGTNATPVKGLAFLQATFRRAYNGNIKIFLPQTTPEGAKVDWSNSNVLCQATINGSYSVNTQLPGPSGQSAYVTPLDTVQVTQQSSNAYFVRVKAATPQKVSISFSGIQGIS
jgi:hypothetical protein